MYKVFLAVEDEPSKEVALKILDYCREDFVLNHLFPMRGCGDLKKNMVKFNNIANNCFMFVLADSDQQESVFDFQNMSLNWLSHRHNQGLAFCIAVSEVESWILADIDSVKSYFNVANISYDNYVDNIRDPKLELINLSRRSRSKEIVQGMIPIGNAPIGPSYNALLSEFIRNYWDISEAISRSNSLRATIEKINSMNLNGLMKN
ncbi:hypothetical protein [Ferrimonas marina]|uniref:DUF4276 family protein n=1 Tax=Ferrimonas marina TaxID=299255 RepID=A0A1M5S4C2_9GAMM|nr:hypothetical protein [Ferrimonas marina]SHH32803.1 hypothetical protein SAMN02745129_1849 [Ferrimonas marina]